MSVHINEVIIRAIVDSGYSDEQKKNESNDEKKSLCASERLIYDILYETMREKEER